jgi:hypothetical protein
MFGSRTIGTAFAVVLLLTGSAIAALDDNPGQPGADTPLGRILNDWERRSSARSSVDVRFTRTDRHTMWGDKENYTGRVVLLPKGLALVEMMKRDRAGQMGETDRFVWTSEEFHQFRAERKEHIIWPIAEKDRGRLPADLALPFCWHLSAAGLKSRYRIELLKELPETWLFRIKPLSESSRQAFSTAFLYVDRATYLPRRYYLISPDGKSTQDFRVTEVRATQPTPADLLPVLEDADWNVSRINKDSTMSWFSSFFKPDLLP